MTTLVLQAADSLIGGVAGVATSLAGRAVTGLFAVGGAKAQDSIRVTEGPRLTEMSGLASTEGAPIPRIYGRTRIGGHLIWASRFEEVANTTVTQEREAAGRGGKSIGGGSSAGGGRAAIRTTTSTTYSYFANLAIGLCEGEIALVRRVWADSRELDLTTITMRVHTGTESQEPDPLIVSREGDAPGYRGLAYVVFERLPLATFGNRVPQFSFEVVRPAGALRHMIRSVCLIPGSTEFGYETDAVLQDLGLGATAPENIHQLQSTTDIAASLDALQALCPNCRRVSLVVAWFGDDLRAGACAIEPRVDLAGKSTLGAEWSVAGIGRASARETSRAGGVAAYGGTPSDASVAKLIAALKARGFAVTLYPFVMMDIPAGNALPDPRTGASGQPPYPWRGRITCDPAFGMPGSVDGTEAAESQVAAFFGTAAPAHFTLVDGRVVYVGPDEWRFRRLVLHYAHLAVAAGGVESFVIGSELVGLTRIQGLAGTYPATVGLRSLAADIRAVLGTGTAITYAADWTEYGADVRHDGAEVRFPLDPLWADPTIDAVGIDWYPPLSDWRDGPHHLDLGEARGPQDLDYLRSRLGAGEAFDWYYAGPADRSAQRRTPITDGAYGKPWTFRAKDLVGWWANPHVERLGGVEIGPTAWSPQGKPIWLTEIGIPAVDKGPNGPNVFPDPKSAESALPPFSSGMRDDLVQHRGLQAILSRFDPALPGYPAGANPVSVAYGGPMVAPGRSSVWCWDARPFPAFPDFTRVWADGPNWSGGHWITGRIEGAPLDGLVAAILSDHGLDPGGAETLDGFLDGYVIDRPMSARDALEPLAQLFGFDAVASGGMLRFRGRGGRVDLAIPAADLVMSDDEPVTSRIRAQETDLPASIELGFTDGEGPYLRAAVGSRRLAGTSRRELAVDAAIVTRRAEAQRLADTRLQDIWAGRETVEFALDPRAIAVEPGDVLALPGPDGSNLYRVVRIEDGETRRILARAVEPAIFDSHAVDMPSAQTRAAPPVAGPPHPVILDLPIDAERPDTLQHIAVAADPWPGAVAIYRSMPGGTLALQTVLDLPAVIGRTTTAFAPGPVWRWDRVCVLEVEWSASGPIASVEPEAALAGANLMAVLGPDGASEIVSAARVELTGPRRYRLSRFLRGLGGTERLSGRTVPPGATVVLLDRAVAPLAAGLAELGRSWTYRVGPASRDPGDASFVTLAATVGADALRPLAPVRLKARRGPDGVVLSWIRRTRLDGDAWEPVDVPLGEDREAYRVEILADVSLVRTLASDGQTALYRDADELADFGAPQTTLSLRVSQTSAAAGRGFDAAGTVPIT